ncbi:MAG: GNAT family N-acetyltransferase [Acidobacteriaceae bacterium]|nr:GNAT family N-acetyltransferase [Acidobacteriaceae bacterium]
MPKFSGNPVFETCRLRLRTLQPGDEEFLALLDSDPEVMQYVHSGPLSRHAALEFAKTQIELTQYRQHLHKWIIEFRDHPIQAGWVELSKFEGVFDPEHSLGDDISLGYELAPSFWNKGIAAEAARPVLAYAFEALKLNRVVAFTRIDNVRSARVLEKLEFQQQARRHHKDDAGNECWLHVLWATHWRTILDDKQGASLIVDR